MVSHRILHWLFFRNEPATRIVRVKSWRPWWGPHGLEWPTMLIDQHGYNRMTVTPCVWTYVFPDRP